MTVTDVIYQELEKITDPCSTATGSNLNIVEMGLIKDVHCDDGEVTVEMRLTSPMCHMVPYFIEQVEKKVAPIHDVDSVELETDAGYDWNPDMMAESAKQTREDQFQTMKSKYADDLPMVKNVSEHSRF